MSKEKELKTLSDGEYVFAETKIKNQYHFYREDGQKLGEVGNIPMDMYRNYMCMKMFEGGVTNMVANNIRFDTSDCDTCIRITTFALGEKDPFEQREEKGLKSLVKSLFKNKR